MQPGPAWCAAFALAASAAAAADLPDTSERFREAMSICTLPGPGLEARLARLAATGWTPERPTAEDATILRDAALLDTTPTDDPAAWAALRTGGDPIRLPDTVHRHGPARLLVTEDPASGAPSCRLATLNSADSDQLFEDLAAAGAVTATGPVRHAAMVTTSLDASGTPWRTEVRFSSADTSAANALFETPLAATLSAYFVTRPVP